MMSSIVKGGGQQLEELDRIIIDTEFETLQQVKAIVEEQQKKQDLQVLLEDHLSKISKTEEETKLIQDRLTKLDTQLFNLKQSYQSLKATSGVLDEHCEALQRSLHMSMEETANQRKVQQDACSRYTTIWTNYQQKYHNSSKAQEYLASKNELESLKSLRASLLDRIKQSKPQLSTTSINGYLNEMIVELSKVKHDTSCNERLINALRESCIEKAKQIQEKAEEAKRLRSQVKQTQAPPMPSKVAASTIVPLSLRIPKLSNETLFNKPFAIKKNNSTVRSILLSTVPASISVPTDVLPQDTVPNNQSPCTLQTVLPGNNYSITSSPPDNDVPPVSAIPNTVVMNRDNDIADHEPEDSGNHGIQGDSGDQGNSIQDVSGDHSDNGIQGDSNNHGDSGNHGDNGIQGDSGGNGDGNDQDTNCVFVDQVIESSRQLINIPVEVAVPNPPQSIPDPSTGGNIPPMVHEQMKLLGMKLLGLAETDTTNACMTDGCTTANPLVSNDNNGVMSLFNSGNFVMNMGGDESDCNPPLPQHHQGDDRTGGLCDNGLFNTDWSLGGQDNNSFNMFAPPPQMMMSDNGGRMTDLFGGNNSSSFSNDGLVALFGSPRGTPEQSDGFQIQGFNIGAGPTDSSDSSTFTLFQ